MQKIFIYFLCLSDEVLSHTYLSVIQIMIKKLNQYILLNFLLSLSLLTQQRTQAVLLTTFKNMLFIGTVHIYIYVKRKQYKMYIVYLNSHVCINKIDHLLYT